jgi:hypothetical protein
VKEAKPEPGEPAAAKAIRENLVEYAGTYGIWWMHEAAFRMKQLEKKVIELHCQYEKLKADVNSNQRQLMDGLVRLKVVGNREEALKMLRDREGPFGVLLWCGESEVI